MNVPTQDQPALADIGDSRRATRDSSATVSLRCYAYAAGRNRFVGECIDLDIAVEETSLDGAVLSLNNAVEGYLIVAMEGDRHGLIPRPSPISHRALYRYRVFMNRLSSVFSFNRQPALKRFDLEQICH